MMEDEKYNFEVVHLREESGYLEGDYCLVFVDIQEEKLMCGKYQEKQIDDYDGDNWLDEYPSENIFS